MRLTAIRAGSLIGKSIPRVDSRLKITGKAVYIYDLNIPWVLHGAVKRSPHPHAKIISVDISKAERLRGVRAVVTGKDCLGATYGLGIYDTPVLAYDLVRYVGEPVAAVAADNAETAQEAIDLIQIEYEKLKPVLDPEEAMAENPSIKVHSNLISYGRSPVHAPNPHPKRSNVSNFVVIEQGDVEESFKSSHLVVENKYTAPMIHHCALEPHAAIARWEPDGSVTIWSSTQSLYRLRAELSKALQMPLTKIRVVSSYVGGGFGGKVSTTIEPIAAVLSRKAQRPVRIALTRTEIFAYTPPRHPFTIYAKDGVDKEGMLLARYLKIVLDGGAYSGGSGYMVARTSITPAIGAYRVSNLLLESYRVCTHRVPGGTWRGVGEAQVNWAVEQQMDALASELKMDPVDFRLKNLFHEGEVTPSGARLTAHAADKCLLTAAQAIEWGKDADNSDNIWVVGKGLATAVGAAGGRGEGSAAVVKVQHDATLDLWMGGLEIGNGSYTVMSQIVADEFRTTVESVRIPPPDTIYSPFDPGAFASRQTFILGNAVRRACIDAKSQLFSRASMMLDTKADELELENGVIYVRDDESRRLRIEDLFRGKTRMGPFLDELGEFIGKASWGLSLAEVGGQFAYSQGRTEASVTSAATGAVVAVNTETGYVKPLRLVVAVDVGKAINPDITTEQIRGGAFMGMSTALAEELIQEEGRIMNPDFMDYKVLGAKDACSIEPILIEYPSPEGPYGAKGVGEIPTIGVASALGNAVYDAIGVRIRDLPITAEKVLLCLRDKSA